MTKSSLAERRSSKSASHTNPELNTNPLINEHEVARLTGMSVASVRRWRLFGRGPKFVKIGASCRYKISDVLTFLESLPTGGGGR